MSFMHGGRCFFILRIYLELIIDPLICQSREMELNCKYNEWIENRNSILWCPNGQELEKTEKYKSYLEKDCGALPCVKGYTYVLQYLIYSKEWRKFSLYHPLLILGTERMKFIFLLEVASSQLKIHPIAPSLFLLPSDSCAPDCSLGAWLKLELVF